MLTLGRLYIGNPEKIGQEILFDFYEVPSKKVDEETGKPHMIRFIREQICGEMIKIPSSIVISEESENKSTIDINEELNIQADMIMREYSTNFITMNRKKEKFIQDCELMVDINKKTFSPYLSVSMSQRSAKNLKRPFVYLYMIIDNTCLDLMSCKSNHNIINTFRRPKDNKFGCLAYLTKEDDITIYTRDSSLFGFRKIHIYLENEVKVETTTRLTPEELKECRGLWVKRPKTRVFHYTGKILPDTVITYQHIHDQYPIEVMTREESENDENYVTNIRKSITDAVGYMPRALLLSHEVDLTYEEMMKLGLNYVFQANEEKTEASILKTN